LVESELWPNQSQASSQIVRGVVGELKNPLVTIARLVELTHKTNNLSYLENLKETTEQALELIDSFMLCAQSEYGQKLLPLEPASIGSILYDVAHNASELVCGSNYYVKVDNRYKHPVMIEKKALSSALLCLVQLLLIPNNQSKRKPIELTAFKRANNQIVAGVVTEDCDVNQDNLNIARRLSGKTYSSVNGTNGNGIRLALADSLALSMGGQLIALKRSSKRGFGIELIKSEQLALV